jgi:hypothetical protein
MPIQAIAIATGCNFGEGGELKEAAIIGYTSIGEGRVNLST